MYWLLKHVYRLPQRSHPTRSLSIQTERPHARIYTLYVSISTGSVLVFDSHQVGCHAMIEVEAVAEC